MSLEILNLWLAVTYISVCKAYLAEHDSRKFSRWYTLKLKIK